MRETTTAVNQRSQILVWMDLEMTGLDPSTDQILEIATILTTMDLQIVAEGPELVLHQPEHTLQGMDAWNQRHHRESGLLEKVRHSQVTLEEAATSTLTFIRQHVTEKGGFLAGSSIWQDRRFIRRYMPELDNYLHYRMLDVSSFKLVTKTWYPEASFAKKACHRAKADIIESIEELKFYRQHCFK